MNVPLKQIANVQRATPNVLLSNESFRGWVNTDLVGAYRAALDYHIVTEIAGAGIPTGDVGPGFNIFENIRYAEEAVRSAGYSPDLVVASPGDALSIQLLSSDDAQHYVFAQSEPTLVVSPSVDDGVGFVADASALGRLFLSPFTLQTFEENSGTTNTSTVRAESNGLFLVQRPSAAAFIAGLS